MHLNSLAQEHRVCAKCFLTLKEMGFTGAQCKKVELVCRLSQIFTLKSIKTNQTKNRKQRRDAATLRVKHSAAGKSRCSDRGCFWLQVEEGQHGN